MSFRPSIFSLALIAGFALVPIPMLAETSSSNNKVLAQETTGFNSAYIEKLLQKGDKFASKGKLEEARSIYDEARSASKQLISFYRDLAGSFRGLDARIPREMDTKRRTALKLLANVNLRLAALFRREGQPEIAVPLLVEVVRLMTPVKDEGKEAYQTLLELGFVDTPYKGGRR